MRRQHERPRHPQRNRPQQQLVCSVIWDLSLPISGPTQISRNGEPLHEDADGSELKPRKQINPCTSLKLNSAYHFPPTELSCGKDQRVHHCREGWLVGRHGCCFLFFFRRSAISLSIHLHHAIALLFASASSVPYPPQCWPCSCSFIEPYNRTQALAYD